MEKNIYKLTEISKKHVDVAGGKGASLGEMTQAGFPIPEGFVVSSRVFDVFLQENGLNVEIDAILRKTNAENIHSVKSSSDKIMSLISKNEIPENINADIMAAFKGLDVKHVAVRSSATAEDSATSTWAGQLDTYLDTTESGLLKNVKKCWASLFSPRAVFYHLDKKFHDDSVLVAVVIQKMVNSDVSGVSFSVHPVTEDENQLLIEAGYGLGESIVSGQITPDSYIVCKNEREIISINVRNQTRGLFPAKEEGVEWRKISDDKKHAQKLSKEEILAITETVIKIEDHYQFPVDVEWAKKDGDFFIIQSRPMTTLKKVVFADDVDKKSVLLKGQSKSYSLFSVKIRYDVFKNELEKITGFSSGEICAVYGEGGAFDIYHEEKPLKKMSFLIEKLAHDNEKIKKLIEDYGNVFLRMKPYYEGEKIINNIEELRTFYNLCLESRTLHAIVAAIPEINFLPEETKNKARKVRRDAIEYAGYDEKVFSIYLKEFFPSLAENVHLIYPEEVWQELSPEKMGEEIKKRTSGVVFYDGELCTEETNKCVEEFNITLKEAVRKAGSDELEGQSTYPGKVRGIARIVITTEDLEKIAEGEIIVSSTTTPEHIPVMRKVAAIITDEGGIGSHTAIISREMKKPCIVGLEVATKNINDGDEIEVDADRGVVRIIKRKTS